MNISLQFSYVLKFPYTRSLSKLPVKMERWVSKIIKKFYQTRLLFSLLVEGTYYNLQLASITEYWILRSSNNKRVCMFRRCPGTLCFKRIQSTKLLTEFIELLCSLCLLSFLPSQAPNVPGSTQSDKIQCSPFFREWCLFIDPHSVPLTKNWSNSSAIKSLLKKTS